MRSILVISLLACFCGAIYCADYGQGYYGNQILQNFMYNHPAYNAKFYQGVAQYPKKFMGAKPIPKYQAGSQMFGAKHHNGYGGKGHAVVHHPAVPFYPQGPGASSLGYFGSFDPFYQRPSGIHQTVNRIVDGTGDFVKDHWPSLLAAGAGLYLLNRNN